MKKKQKTYKYVLELTEPIYPRRLADELSFCKGIFNLLVRIIDMQNKSHIYGNTYTVNHDEE